MLMLSWTPATRFAAKNICLYSKNFSQPTLPILSVPFLCDSLPLISKQKSAYSRSSPQGWICFPKPHVVEKGVQWRTDPPSSPLRSSSEFHMTSSWIDMRGSASPILLSFCWPRSLPHVACLLNQPVVRARSVITVTENPPCFDVTSLSAPVVVRDSLLRQYP